MTIIQLKVRCPKCRDGLFGGAPCPYCAGEVFVEAKIAHAIRMTNQEVQAFWCDCVDPATEVMLSFDGLYCVACLKRVQEEFSNLG